MLRATSLYYNLRDGPKSKPRADLSLNLIKTVNKTRFFVTKFEFKRTFSILYVDIIYSMSDLICDVINYCV